MSLHTWHSQGSYDPNSCTTLMLNPHWGRTATQKSVLHLCMQGCFSHVQVCDPVDCGLPQSKDSPGKNTGVSFRTLLENHISCCHKLPTPLNIWCRQGICDPSNCSTSTPGTHWDQGPAKSSRTALGANPVDDLHTEMEIKPQLKPRGSMAKQEDPKPSYQLYKL